MSLVQLTNTKSLAQLTNTKSLAQLTTAPWVILIPLELGCCFVDFLSQHLFFFFGLSQLKLNSQSPPPPPGPPPPPPNFSSQLLLSSVFYIIVTQKTLKSAKKLWGPGLEQDRDLLSMNNCPFRNRQLDSLKQGPWDRKTLL